jgi:hypothetical protein
VNDDLIPIWKAGWLDLKDTTQPFVPIWSGCHPTPEQAFHNPRLVGCKQREIERH